MFPIRDENPTYRVPIFTVGFMAACILIYIMQFAAGPQGGRELIYSYGFIPSVFFGINDLPRELDAIPPFLTLFTSMFMHGDWMHLLGNMLFLWIFGNNIEDDLGHGRFVIFYFACGIAAAFAQGIVNTSSTIPMVGASGAISGILGAYILLYPRAKVVTLVFLGFLVTTARISAVWYLGIWFLIQAVSALATPTDGGGVAFWAHVGGFVAGVALLFVLRPQQGLARPTMPGWRRPARRPRSPPPKRRKGPWG